MDILITLVSLVVALSILVFVHEFGHYIAARKAGIVVEEFAIGFPPRLFRLLHTRGKIVIGGRTLIIPSNLTLPQGLQAGSRVRIESTTDDKDRWVLGHIEEVADEQPGAEMAQEIEFLDPGTLFTVNAIPFGGYAKMLGEEDPTHPGSFASKGKFARVVVLAAGATMNLLAAVLFFSLALGLGGAPVVADPENAVIQQVVPGSPAEVAGLQKGDIILKADSAEILKMQDLVEHLWAARGQAAVLQVQRGDHLLEVNVVPRVNPPDGEGPIGVALGARTTIRFFSWHEALWVGARQTASSVALIVTLPVQLIQGLIPAEAARPVGPVGLGQIMGDAVNYSLDTGWWFPVIQLMGSLSVALAVTNLLPLPGLDGGRILFVIVEAIRGRRVDPAREGLVHLIGLMLLVMLMLFITWQDLSDPIRLDWSAIF